MSFALPDLPVSVSDVTPKGTACIAAAIFLVIKFARPSKLDAIPTVGSSSWFGSWRSAFKFLTDGIDTIQEGYNKHKFAPFKVADRYRWIVIVSSREHIEEVRKAPDDELSLADAMDDLINTHTTLGDEVRDEPHRNAVIRLQLTRNIGVLHPEIKDEIEAAFDEILDLKGNEWESVLLLNTIQKIVCRTSNRAFVGLPLCRNPDWIDLNIQYTVDVVKTGLFLSLFPRFMRPLAYRFFSAISRDTMRGLKLLGPVIEERGESWNEGYAEKPNDFLSWFREETQGSQLTAKRLAGNLLFLNFSAIHATSGSFTLALLYLAAHPEFILPLREEVEGIVKKEGWSKTSLSKMRKLDSFLRECQRMEAMAPVGMTRMAMKDFTFSDGTFIPKGTTIGVPTRCLHYDEKFYENPHEFQPFRFVDTQEDGEGAKHQLVSASIEYHPFGYGKHACPGRFFAANVMKTLLAHIVTTYDVKLENGTTQPPSLRFAIGLFPDPNAKVLFRRRVD